METTRISHYELGRLLGRGGMGEVYEALDLDLDRRVALKFVAPELSADADALKRFEREARAAAALNHPHIATLYAFEREGARSFIAMELVGGESVRDTIRRGPLPVATALAIARDAAGALALAHRRGIVHRDVKPENLMFDLEGAVKLMDFGLARAVQASRITVSGSTLGTAAYMPPESTRGGAGAPGDVFALGVMLHEMLAGELPFPGDSPLAMLYTIANEEPRPLRVTRPEAPEAVAALVLRMLAKDPEQRPDAASVARELATITGAPLPMGAGDTVELPVERLPGTDRPSGAETMALERTPPIRRRRRGAFVFFGLLLGGVVAVALVVVAGLRSRDTERRAGSVVLNNRGLEAMRRGEMDSAQAMFRAALARDPRSGSAMLNLGSVLERQGHRPQAESLYSAVLRQHRDEPALMAQAHYNLGSMDLDVGAWESALANLERSFRYDSTTALAYNNYGLALVRAGRAQEAQRLLDRGMRRFPDEGMLAKNAGLAAFTIGEDQEALRHLDRALDRNPAIVSAWGLRACVRARLRDDVGARSDWEAYVALGPLPAEREEFERELRARGVEP